MLECCSKAVNSWLREQGIAHTIPERADLTHNRLRSLRFSGWIRLPAAGDLPARRQLLDPAVGRDWHPPRPCRHDRLLRLVDPPFEPVMTARPTGAMPTGRDRTGNYGWFKGLQLMKEPAAQALAVTQTCDRMLLFMFASLVKRFRLRSSTYFSPGLRQPYDVSSGCSRQ